jgi:cytochrome c-type biogenesis protein
LSPILGIASQTDTLGRGIALLAVYSLGLGVPFIIAGFLTSRVIGAMNRIKPHFRRIEIASGILLVLMGVLIFTGRLQEMAGSIEQLFS